MDQKGAGKGASLELLRARLADLESRQRATGGTAEPGFFAPEPVPTTATTGSTGTATSAYAAGPGRGEGAGSGFRLPLRLEWDQWVRVPGRLAPTFAFAAGITALPGLASTGVGEADLIESVAQLGRLQQVREVSLVRLVTELQERGVDSPGGLSRVDWLRGLDPTLSAGQAKAIVTCAVGFTESRWQHLREAVTGENPSSKAPAGAAETRPDEVIGQGTTGADATAAPGPDDVAANDAGVAGEAAAGGRVTVGKAARIIEFHDRLVKVADPGELEQAIGHLIGQARVLRFEQLGRLARELGEQVRPPVDADRQDRVRRESRGLWFTEPNGCGMVSMSGVLDPEGAAIIRSAIDPLSAPRPLTDAAGHAIEADPRPGQQRRMDALLEIVGRGVSSPGAAPYTEKAKIVVTIELAALSEALRAHQGQHPAFFRPDPDPATHPDPAGPGATRTGQTGGSDGAGGVCLSGDVLSAGTVRRLACDAGIVPMVLGSLGQPLDVGRQVRLITRSMRTALWRRDGGCTFPGCSMPPAWTDAHHVTHWLYGGKTAISNLALLCRRHHTYVHQQHLTATISATGVHWHTWQQWRTEPEPPDQPPDQPPGDPQDPEPPDEPPSCLDTFAGATSTPGPAPKARDG